jgi:cytochrome c peroxidase
VSAGEFTDVGLYAVTYNEADKAKFKTPSLRNIAQRKPYMSDGSLTDLNRSSTFISEPAIPIRIWTRRFTSWTFYRGRNRPTCRRS